MNTKCYLIFAVTFLKAKKTSSFCFCWLLSAKLWMGEKTMFTRHGKNNLLKPKIKNYCSWWGSVMTFGGVGWLFLLENPTSSIFTFYGKNQSGFWILSSLPDQPYSNSTENLLNPSSQSDAGGEGHQGSQRRFPRRATSGGDLKEFNLMATREGGIRSLYWVQLGSH